MLKSLKESFSNIDKKILKIMNLGIIFCVSLAILSAFILLTYSFILKSPDLYYSGLLLFKSSLFFLVDFIVCGFATDIIQKQII